MDAQTYVYEIVIQNGNFALNCERTFQMVRLMRIPITVENQNIMSMRQTPELVLIYGAHVIDFKFK